MGAASKLFTGFGKLFSKDVSKVASKTATKTSAKATAARSTEKAIEKAAVAKNPAVNTATKMYTKSAGESVLKTTAQDIAGSKTVKVTGKVAAGTVIIGGSAYALGKLGGKAMESVGYGYRDLTNTHTPQENTAEDLKNRATEQELNQEQFDFLKDFYDWANKNGYTDSPSVREAYNDYIKGNDSGTSAPTEQESKSNLWLIGAGVLAAAAGVYIYKTRKKKGKK